MELQLQVEAAKVRAMARGNTSDAATIEFMDLHHEQKKKRSTINTGVHHTSRGNGPSAVEMVAMSAMPSQLPELATSVLNRDDSMPTSNVEQKQRLLRNSRKSAATRKAATDAQQSCATVSKIPSKNVSTIMKARKAAMESSNMQHHATSKKSLDSNRSGRVSHEEELQLARIIQRGVELHNIKSKFENENGRDITRQEWAELAKLESPKQLRRLVSDYRKAKNKLVMANMGLVHAVVRARMGMSGSAAKDAVGKNGISYEEMVQEGSLGLLRAAELFDPSRGLRFSTYATIWIKGVLGNSNVSDTISVPLREKTKYNKIQTSIADLQMEFGANDASYKPTDEEISERSGIDVETVKQVMRKMRRAKNVLSLDYQYETKGRSGVVEGEYEALSNDKNLMDDVDLVERLHVRADVIAAIVRNLDPREARLIRLRYGLNDGRMRTIKDCAEAMGISQARAQQLAAGCLKKLREADDAESLQEYLLSVA
jgi:RNA polymerase primary sigma factor